MAATNDIVTYNFNLGVTLGENNQSFTPSLTSTAGMTDATALALQEAWLGLPWPQGASAYAFVTKHSVTDVMTDGNPATGTFS